MRDEATPHYVGHRKRLKEKFIKGPVDGFSNYEILELMLFNSIPRRDVKPIAKELLSKFGSFNSIINATKEKLLSVSGVNETTFLNFQITKELLQRLLLEQVIKQNVIASWGDLVDYLKLTMSHLPIEQFRVLFLNKKNILIESEIMASGTIDQAPVYPREVIKRALFHEASAIILVHNHPSGSPKPSSFDIDLTSQIVSACKTVNISVHDHVIIGKGEYYSFKTNLLL